MRPMKTVWELAWSLSLLVIDPRASPLLWDPACCGESFIAHPFPTLPTFYTGCSTLLDSCSLHRVQTDTLLFESLFFFLCMYVCEGFVCVHHIHGWYPRRSEEDIQYPEPGVMVVMSHHVDTGNWTCVFCSPRPSLFD